MPSRPGGSSAKLDIGKARIWVERAAWICGIAALTVWAAVGVSGKAGARRELERFAEFQSHDTLSRDGPAPLAVLRIPRIGLEVAVLEGTDEWILNRAVGHIEDTPAPGALGNSVIAGHRDGFFRGLKDIRSGDVLEIETHSSIDQYRVERTWIVEPEDVSVLDPTSSPAVTLVTCYPFYFIGSAPQRFIVRAVRMETTRRGTTPA